MTDIRIDAAKPRHQAMFRDNLLPFNQRTADRLIAIACSDNVRNETHVSSLPVAWGTLYELTKLTAEQFESRRIVFKQIRRLEKACRLLGPDAFRRRSR
jgi:hypothetical protein